jgi:hypothetical protein
MQPLQQPSLWNALQAPATDQKRPRRFGLAQSLISIHEFVGGELDPRFSGSDQDLIWGIV